MPVRACGRFLPVITATLLASSVGARQAPVPDPLVKENATVIVPAHGPVGDGSLIGANRTLMQAIQTRARELKAQGHSADDTASAVQKEFQAKYPGWPRANGLGPATRAAYAEAP